jgi:hypothetical protein
MYAERENFSCNRYRPDQNMCKRNEARFLQCFSRSDVVRVATRCRDSSHLVSDSFQLLHKVSAQTTSPIPLFDLHVNIAIGMVVPKFAREYCIVLRSP